MTITGEMNIRVKCFTYMLSTFYSYSEGAKPVVWEDYSCFLQYFLLCDVRILLVSSVTREVGNEVKRVQMCAKICQCMAKVRIAVSRLPYMQG